MKPVLKALWSLASGKWRCGVCLFELGFGIMPLEIDIIGSYGAESVFWSSDYHEISHENLIKSSQRGCRSCKKIIEAFNALHTSFVKAQWWSGGPGRSGERPRLVIGETQQVFELCVSPENYSEAIPSVQPCICTGRKLPGSTRDAASLDQAARWLAACQTDHEQCRAKDTSFQPTRLLFLGDKDQKTIRLVENEASCTMYAALSHRWTEETQQVRLEHRNMAQRKQDGISLSEFPSMMQDAILIFRRLGILYVWIDCMCIIQDDKEDWKREAATMASVYANAELTLAATWCADSGQSLFQDNSGTNITAVDVRDVDGTPIFLRPVWPHYTERDTEDDLLAETEWPLLTRAWVYQEQFLSRRMLHFTRHEIFWECNEELDCECGWYRPGNSSKIPLVSQYKRPAASKQWSQIISEYSRRDLTFKSDSLPALSGIAKSFGWQRPDAGKYLCGLWEGELESCFFWYLTEPARARPDIGRMPSWSWASVTGNVTCWEVSLEGIEFLGSEVTYHGDAYMGDVEVAKITLCGSVAPATIYHGHQWTDMQKHISAAPILEEDRDIELESGEASFGLKVGDQFATFQPDYRLDDLIHGSTHIASGSRVVCLTFGRITGIRNDPELERKERWVSACCLVLRCVDEDQELYERLGVCRGSHIGNRLDLETTLNMSQRKQLNVV
ncbi:HET-domain-containing protein [Stipitochalara longipes BDJ]|nr:HET-domain-containing protein [Stipitochalara longipes BDJ]